MRKREQAVPRHPSVACCRVLCRRRLNGWELGLAQAGRAGSDDEPGTELISRRPYREVSTALTSLCFEITSWLPHGSASPLAPTVLRLSVGLLRLYSSPTFLALPNAWLTSPTSGTAVALAVEAGV